VTHFIATQHDITARKQAEDERERLLGELQRITAELQQFAYIVSHDLNEPLRTISNFITLLARRYQGNLDAEANEYIALAVEGAQRMQQMIQDLLAYTRAGQVPEVETVDCEAVIAHVMEAIQLRIAECEAVITNDPLPTIPGDATRLGQVFQNLISNALKFRSAAPPRIHIWAQREGDSWRFAVRDNGIGLDPAQADRIFQVFQRLHTRNEYSGTGVGLAICKKIIEQHGGRIWVESAPGQGATFFFTLKE
jgi:light-regulated signal transduction histidine kinase (bacteriophytochrome)